MTAILEFFLILAMIFCIVLMAAALAVVGKIVWDYFKEE